MSISDQPAVRSAVAGEPEATVPSPPEAVPEPAAALETLAVVVDPVSAADAGTPLPDPVPRPRDRRRLRAVLRWTSAVLVFAALGGATAYAVSQPRRTDVPGLQTPDDGRWTYPALALPKLPAGKPRVFDEERNPGGAHYADLHALLLPAARGAKADRTFDGKDGWLPDARFAELFEKAGRTRLMERLDQNGLRHIAARAWDMPDGTRTEIYLVQFISAPYAEKGRLQMMTVAGLADSPSKVLDPAWQDALSFPEDVNLSTFDENKPFGGERARSAFIGAGDTVAVISMRKAGDQPAVPFHQAVLLQSQLLG
ncbi:hypothetical protein ABZ883_26035 [Streptomyces sp. NPDC046977]|uniref:hypothetical protein n=1 Tax=Streptomyces sp. NPDC046977 TaxID=3154703 RepID=UPI0033BFE5C7